MPVWRAKLGMAWLSIGTRSIPARPSAAVAKLFQLKRILNFLPFAMIF
jgi:hypothetical protein